MSAPLLELREVSREFDRDGHRLRAVDRVSLSLDRGEVLGLAGESGSGKTTLSRLAIGLLPMTAATPSSSFAQDAPLPSVTVTPVQKLQIAPTVERVGQTRAVEDVALRLGTPRARPSAAQETPAPRSHLVK